MWLKKALRRIKKIATEFIFEEAIQDQIGLKLASVKGPIEFLMIDHCG
jgi:uncharacterized protein (TIGR03435 family)